MKWDEIACVVFEFSWFNLLRWIFIMSWLIQYFRLRRWKRKKLGSSWNRSTWPSKIPIYT